MTPSHEPQPDPIPYSHEPTPGEAEHDFNPEKYFTNVDEETGFLWAKDPQIGVFEVHDLETGCANQGDTLAEAIANLQGTITSYREVVAEQNGHFGLNHEKNHNAQN